MEGDCNVYAHSSLWMRPTGEWSINAKMVYYPVDMTTSLSQCFMWIIDYSHITPPLKVPLFNACAVFPNVSRYYQAWSTPHFWTVRVGYGRVAHSVARILNGKITSEKICILKTIFLNFRPMSPRYSGTQSKLRCHCFHCRNLRWGT